MKTALLVFGATDGDTLFSADLLWRSGFKAPDPFTLIEIEDKKILFLSPLEIDRARKESRADEFVPLHEYVERSDGKTFENGLALFLKERDVGRLIVPTTTPYALAKYLEASFTIETKRAPFYLARTIKSPWEIQEITKAQRAVEGAVHEAHAFLAACRIAGDRILTSQRFGIVEAVTSEMIRTVIDRALFKEGYLGISTIVAGGLQAADPHCNGFGLLKPHEPIVMDVFPRSQTSHYYADMTRTFFKGKPSQELGDMYRAVLESQEDAINQIRAGASGKTIVHWTRSFLTNSGYPTSLSNPVEGFFHGLGHGVGLDIHEPPALSMTDWVLEENNVVTVEPGLYYQRAREHIPAGGIRIEDMGVVRREGFENLTRMPKNLAFAIIE